MVPILRDGFGQEFTHCVVDSHCEMNARNSVSRGWSGAEICGRIRKFSKGARQ